MQFAKLLCLASNDVLVRVSNTLLHSLKGHGMHRMRQPLVDK